VRRYRSHGPNGPGVYPQCVPGGNERPHPLAWPTAASPAGQAREDLLSLSKSQYEVLTDAADGLTSQQSAARRHKGKETIKTQRSQVLLKLQARNMAHAVAIAIGRGLIPGHTAMSGNDVRHDVVSEILVLERRGGGVPEKTRCSDDLT
jgi:DNA-binding CsgD family transcriptional regulator